MLKEKQEYIFGKLSSEEEELCYRFSILPKQYFLLKEVIQRETAKQGLIERESTAKMFKIERNIIDGIIDFLIDKK